MTGDVRERATALILAFPDEKIDELYAWSLDAIKRARPVGQARWPEQYDEDVARFSSGGIIAYLAGAGAGAGAA